MIIISYAFLALDKVQKSQDLIADHKNYLNLNLVGCIFIRS